MTMQELVLWSIGVVIAIVLAFYGVKKVRTSRQVQKTGSGSTSIQSGRDTTIK